MARKKNTNIAAAAQLQDAAQAVQDAMEATAAIPAGDASDAPVSEPVEKPADDISDKAPAGKSAALSKATQKNTRGVAKAPATVRESAAQRVAREVFRSYPDRKAVHVASDGTAFFNRCDAVNYGRTLKDTTVVEVINQKNKA